MDAIENRSMFEELAQQRMELRNRLADAWELCKPVEVIRRIEGQLKAVWAAIDAAAAAQQSEPTPKRTALDKPEPTVDQRAETCTV